MQLMLLAVLALLLGGNGKSDLSGLLSGFSELGGEHASEKNIDDEIDEVISHLAGGEIAEVMKMARVIEGVTKTFNSSSKVFEAEPVEAAANASDSVVTPPPIAPVSNIADGEILHALSAALTN